WLKLRKSHPRILKPMMKRSRHSKASDWTRSSWGWLGVWRGFVEEDGCWMSGLRDLGVVLGWDGLRDFRSLVFMVKGGRRRWRTWVCKFSLPILLHHLNWNWIFWAMVGLVGFGRWLGGSLGGDGRVVAKR
ncbi:unnamed protein product, partial [Prunus brigantina]